LEAPVTELYCLSNALFAHWSCRFCPEQLVSVDAAAVSYWTGVSHCERPDLVHSMAALSVV